MIGERWLELADQLGDIAPGHPERSVLLYRLAHRGEGTGQMPQLATNSVDRQAVQLFEQWIRTLTPEP